MEHGMKHAQIMVKESLYEAEFSSCSPEQSPIQAEV